MDKLEFALLLDEFRARLLELLTTTHYNHNSSEKFITDETEVINDEFERVFDKLGVCDKCLK